MVDGASNQGKREASNRDAPVDDEHRNHGRTESGTATGGFNAADFTALATSFDDPIYDADVAAFGEPSDMDGNGKVLAVLGKSDLGAFDRMGGQRVERCDFKAADGVTQLYGTIHKPSNFDPSKRYPVIVEVYNGPQSAAHNENFQLPDTTTELGFIVATFESRGGDNRGQAF